MYRINKCFPANVIPFLKIARKLLFFCLLSSAFIDLFLAFCQHEPEILK